MNEKKNSQIIRPFGFFIRPLKKKINKIKFSEKKKIRPFRNIYVLLEIYFLTKKLSFLKKKKYVLLEIYFLTKKIKFFEKKKNTSF